MNRPLVHTPTSSIPARVIGLTCLAMVAFAANSLLCRVALKHTAIDAATFSIVRLASGALVLGLLCLLRRPASRIKGSWPGAAALFVYAFAFSFAYLHLATGTGALLLFGAVQLSMIAWGVFKGERMSVPAILGVILALAGLVSLLLPGATMPDPASALLMLLAGLASGVGYALWYSAVRGLQAFQAATVQLSVPVLASLAGILVLGEALDTRLVIASVAVLGGVALVLGSRQRAG